MEIAQTARPVTIDPVQPAAKTKISSDFETFLRMLTAQMKNQDPLNPVESSDFATQLATFSGVEQAVLTNDLLKALSAQMGVAGLADLAGWVGKEVRAASPAYFDGTPVTLYPNPMILADAGEIVVRDASGMEVQRFASPPTTDPVQWNGLGAGGFPLPPGVYDFVYVSKIDGQPMGEAAVDVYSRVTEVRSEGGQTNLIVKGGIAIPAGDVTALRALS
ncbi:flagellar hook capping FlgD N-terminal domain-containing protein [Yoonia vestfoldensis]|uniref:flagellar hook capping FlgD N-terminal domain-containing protein n=1 Tax=Yoonia vestfoldensis TaxID=245188 RepID=UPI00039DC92F|nr:flagellar hook capping FlgD N-terminal domain-containing protein [Yoonia vestfoldensis]